MSESNLQKRVIAALMPHGHVHKHHDSSPGVPDLSVCLHGGVTVWVELKYADEPARPQSIVRITRGGNTRSWAAQQLWMDARTRAGGTCKVLLQIGTRSILLFDSTTAGEIFGHSTAAELEERAEWIWDGADLTSLPEILGNGEDPVAAALVKLRALDEAHRAGSPAQHDLRALADTEG